MEDEIVVIKENRYIQRSIPNSSFKFLIGIDENDNPLNAQLYSTEHRIINLIREEDEEFIDHYGLIKYNPEEYNNKSWVDKCYLKAIEVAKRFEERLLKILS